MGIWFERPVLLGCRGFLLQRCVGYGWHRCVWLLGSWLASKVLHELCVCGVCWLVSPLSFHHWLEYVLAISFPVMHVWALTLCKCMECGVQYAWRTMVAMRSLYGW